MRLSPDHPPSDYQKWKRMALIMIDKIPDAGGTIIVFTEDVGRSLKEIMEEIRGADFVRHCKFISVNRQDQIIKVYGLNGNVFIDSSLATNARPEIFQAVYSAVNSIRVMAPAF